MQSIFLSALLPAIVFFEALFLPVIKTPWISEPLKALLKLLVCNFIHLLFIFNFYLITYKFLISFFPVSLTPQ